MVNLLASGQPAGAARLQWEGVVLMSHPPSRAQSLLARLPVGQWLAPADAVRIVRDQGAAVTLCGDAYVVDEVPLASAVRHGRRTGRVVTRPDGMFLRKP
ncbi:hypothetical protein [Kitasatospora sp. NPDC090091]|uniref:hypothetical protein n=1 Tax=Kitasatospora sp. NPDC090091 TaxID=3364081 RepID=UPI0037F569B0